jgi:DNA primase
MYKRGLTNEIIEKFDIGYDVATQCLTFPVYNLDSTPAFIARRSVNTKFFNYPEGAEKPVYCAERIIHNPVPEVIICESILNCLTCWKYGKPAVALIGTGMDGQYKVLRQLPVRKYIIATDPDDAGFNAAHKLREALKDIKIITQLQIPSGEDINSLDDKFLELPEYF